MTAVIPYFGYARSDKRIAAGSDCGKVGCNLVVKAGAQRILTIDLHAAQIQGFFDVPVDHLYAAPIVVDYFKENPIDNLIVVARIPAVPEGEGLRGWTPAWHFATSVAKGECCGRDECGRRRTR